LRKLNANGNSLFRSSLVADFGRMEMLMSRHALWFAVWLLLSVLGIDANSQDKTSTPKLQALYITGGPYHDFKNLAPLLTSKISEFASVEWQIKWGPETFKLPDFGKGFDVVVYNMCFDDVDPTIENVLKLTFGGKPTVAIHCAIHSFKVSDEWRRLLGEVSRVHDPFQAFSTVRVDKDHPVTKNFPENWQTPGDEMYQTIEMGPQAKVLLKAKSPSSGKEHMVCWTNQYGQGRVFGTTLGHDLKTAGQTDYHRLLSYGLLWACGKLGDDGRPLPGYGGTNEK
jgi:type 1 glutamine amidotransferase